ncbi:MAG: DNA polymerase I [Eubacteriaceae bacterium]
MADQTSILIDGNSLLYRLFYGMRPMNSAKGVPTNAVFGFVNILLKIKNDYNPDYLGVAFDLSAPTFRHEMYEDYKAGREKMPEDLQVQQDIMYKLLQAMDIPQITKKGYEADDILGTLAKRGGKENIKTSIVTGDRDSFQLVDQDVSILYTATRSGSQFADVNEAYIEEKYGVTPEELKTVKALMGDKSDNIPGIAGIGEKTALKLVRQYKDLDNLYAHIDEQKGKLKERLILGKESAYASLKLGTIDCEVPLDVTFEELKLEPMLTPESEAIMKDLGLKSILAKMEKESGTDNGTGNGAEKNGDQLTKTRYITVENSRDVIATLSKLNRAGEYIVCDWTEDPETDLSHEDFSAAWLGLEIDSFYYYIGDPDCVRQFIRGLCEIPNADSIRTSGHNLKHLEKLYNHYESNIPNFSYDSYLASYLIDPSNQQYDLSAIALKWLDQSYPSEEDLFGKGKKRISVADLETGVLADWLIAGCEIIKKTRPMMTEKIEEDGMGPLFRDIELKLVPVLADMEETGFAVDLHILETLSERFGKKLDQLSKEIFELGECEPFNLGSTKQLGELLFDKMGLPVIKKTKTGYSTSADVLQQLEPFSPIIGRILEYRMLSKLDSTYGKGLITFVDRKTDRIYSTFQQTVTTTGRLSSADPNLQNIPVKTEEGREIRKAFIASGPDRILVDADYSQIELRILAELSGDPNLIDAFKHDLDIHASTAAKVFKEDQEDVTPTQRRFAKMINFGLIYGKQAFSLANDLGVSRQEAQGFIDRYFAEFPKIKDYLDQSIEDAKQNGYAQTLWGRRRYLPEINSRNRMVMQSGERMALNMPIQGAAADIMKIAMINVWQKLDDENLDAKIVLQVHDELIIDCAKDQADRVKQILVDGMEHAVDLGVPLKVEANMAESWYESK